MTRLFIQDPVQFAMQNEIDRLRKELNNALSAVHWRDLEIDRLRQRVAEVEAELSELVDAKYQARKELRKDAERYRAWRASALDEGYAEYDLQGKTEQDVDAMCDQMIEEAP